MTLGSIHSTYVLFFPVFPMLSEGEMGKKDYLLTYTKAIKKSAGNIKGPLFFSEIFVLNEL